MISNM